MFLAELNSIFLPSLISEAMRFDMDNPKLHPIDYFETLLILQSFVIYLNFIISSSF